MTRRIVTWGQRPEFWLGLLLLWTVISALRSWHTPWARAAGTEALRWGAGVTLALALGYGLRRLQLAAQALTVLLAALVLTTLAAGLGPSGLISGPFHDHQLCASALLVLLPFAVALALAADAPVWRWGAQIVSLAAAVCLVLTQTRSAWIGAGLAALVFSISWVRSSSVSSPTRLSRRRAWIVPALLIVCVAGSFAALASSTDFGGLLTARARTLQSVGQDGSWQGRVETWRGALRMMPARPLAGWGLGRYSGAQWVWTHQGRLLTPAQRPSLSEQAHDLYLQTAIETGGVGLALYLAALTVLFVRCSRSLHEDGPRRLGLSQALRIATMALLAGQGVDALASPSYQFPEVSLLFWAGLGVGLAASDRRGVGTLVCLPPFARRALQSAVAGASAVVLAGQVASIGLLSPVEAYNPGPGMTYKNSTLTASATSATPGSLVTFTLTAHYQDGAGHDYYDDVSTDSSTVFSATDYGTFHNYSASFSKNVLTVPTPIAGHYPINLTVRGHFLDAASGRTYPTGTEDTNLYVTLIVTAPTH